MQSFGTTEWLINRGNSGALAGQSRHVFDQAEAARELVVPAINWIRLIPSWVIMATVLLACTAICGTAILRSRAELWASSGDHQRIQSEISRLRVENSSIQIDIQRLTKDPTAIELAARERLGMVQANDIIVTMDSIESSSSVSSVSFVH